MVSHLSYCGRDSTAFASGGPVFSQAHKANATELNAGDNHDFHVLSSH